jgi:hypothetical protein
MMVTWLIWLEAWLTRRLERLRAARRERLRVRDVHSRPWVWRCMRAGGGGVFDTPPLLRTDALDYVTRKGTHQIVFVDDEHKFIFYRTLA